jgi:competence ComEA-like helix-hairpin-helix protein
MPSFTADERRALLFILMLTALGAAVQIYQRLYPASVTTYAVEIDSTTVLSNAILQDRPESKLERGIDPNVAPAEDLELLPGVGPTLARAIVAFRRDHPPFTNALDLLGVPGIGPKTLDRFRTHLTFP